MMALLVRNFQVIVPAVALFIYSGKKLEKYKYLPGGFDLPLQVRIMIEQKQNAFSTRKLIKYKENLKLVQTVT